ncbi:MAG: alpha/beta hydrolase, partial [Parafilimonas sp.]
MKKLAFILFISIIAMQHSDAQQTINLYDGAVPNSKPYATHEEWQPEDNGDTIVAFTSQPTLTLFLPDKKMANGTAVVICPGGG